MNRVGVVLASSLLLFVASLTISGCSGLECGEGLVEHDGECIQTGLTDECEYGEVRDGDDCVAPEDYCGEGTEYRAGRGTCMPEFPEMSCGEGAQQDGDRCVAPEPVECGEHTHQLDPRDNECVPRSQVCEGGTVFTVVGDQEVCLPGDEVCGDDTVFVEETHLCMPAFDCQPGDVVIDGYCMPEAVELADNIDYEALGNTNPDVGGEAVAIDVAGLGEQAVFGGTIGAPEDLNDDDSLDQIVDVYEFEAQEGDWIEISVQSLGIPNPAFIVLSDDGVEERVSPLTGYRDKMRQITITDDGTYHLAVLPESVLTGEDSLVGDDDWDYVGTLEWIETPSADAHEFGAQNLEGTLGRLDHNFVVVDEFEQGAEVEFNWQAEPAYAEPVATVWESSDEFVGEYRDSTFSVDVPESGQFYVVFDWDVAYGTAGLDYEIWAQERVSIPGGGDVSYGFSADEGDVLYISQDNGYGDTVDLIVTDADDEVIIDSSLETDDFSRYIGLEEGDYTATFENTMASMSVDSFIAYIDVGVQDEIYSFDAVYSGSSNEADHVMQAYYRVEFDDTTYRQLNLTHTGGLGFGRIFVYGVGDEQLERTDDYATSNVETISTIVEFEADTPYVIRVGNDESSSYYFDYDLSFDDVSLFEAGDETSITVSAEDGDVLEMTQNNASGAAVSVEVSDDAGDTVVADSVEAGEILYEYGLEAGDYTVTFDNDSGDVVFNLDTDAQTITPVEAETFSAEEGDEVRIIQDNDDDVSVRLFVADEDGDVVVDESLDASTPTYFDAEAGGDYTVSYFRPGMSQQEQEVEGIEFSIDFLEAVTLATFDVEENDVVEIDRDDSSGADDIDVDIIDEDTGELHAEETFDNSDFWRHVGVEESGQWSLVVHDFEIPELADYGLSIEVISPEVITDLEQTYTGEASETDSDPQSFYVIELEETTTYDVTITHAGGSGWGRVFIYALGDEQLERLSDYVSQFGTSTDSITFEFEADTPYIVRVGNDGSWDAVFNYELTFD